MDAKVTWHGRLTFTGTADSGFVVPLGGSPSVGGDNDGFRPMEIIATGLAACTAMDVISILAKKRQEVTAFEVQIHTERARDHPKVFTEAVIEYLFTGIQIDEAAVVRAIELSVLRYCSALAMLRKTMPIGYKYSIYEDGGEGGKILVKNGVYSPSQEQVGI